MAPIIVSHVALVCRGGGQAYVHVPQLDIDVFEHDSPYEVVNTLVVGQANTRLARIRGFLDDQHVRILTFRLGAFRSQVIEVEFDVDFAPGVGVGRAGRELRGGPKDDASMANAVVSRDTKRPKSKPTSGSSLSRAMATPRGPRAPKREGSRERHNFSVRL